MANPNAPLDGSGRRFPFSSDPANPGDVYVLLGRGEISLGTGLTKGAHTTVLPPLSTAQRSSVTGDDADTLILDLNVNRIGATITNESTAILYLALGSAAASLTDYTVQVPPGDYYEVPYGLTDEIRGIWSAVNGSARVTEIVLA